MCRSPVGDGAKRVTTGRGELIGDLDEPAEEAGAALIARVADAPRGDPPSWAEVAREWLGAEVSGQIDRWPLWAPVAFGAGCGIYFLLKTEPPLWPLMAVAAVTIAAALASRRAPWRWLVVATTLVACAAAGLAVTKLRSDRVAAPLAPVTAKPVMIEGWVVDVEDANRFVFAPVEIEGLAAKDTPHRLTISVLASAARGATPVPGSAIRMSAILKPPFLPGSPGAYDPGREFWFRSNGGYGLAAGPIEPALLPPAPAGLRREMAVNAWRWDLASRISARMGKEAGGLGAAMTTGYEAWIDDVQKDDMRDSGLAHLISISGLHMAIVGGFVFFLVRLLVACWPWLALRVSGKKVAAAAGLLAVGGYLVVSGHPAPAERAAITAGVAFVAILLDRRAVSFNALAVAAFAVLLLRPESVIQAGFQMSFAATTALVALAEVWPRRVAEIQTPWPITLFQRSVSWLGAAMAVSFVAGLATGPFSVQHFNQVASYGLFANLLESPISTFVTMPALALGGSLEPVGLGAPFLAVASWGVKATLGIAHFVAKLPGATNLVASAPAAALPVSFVGILFICLWKGWLRWLGLPVAAAVLLWPRGPAPDLWAAPDGSAVAQREGKQIVLMRPEAKEFEAKAWGRRHGLVETNEPNAVERRFRCGRFSCVSRAGRTPRLSAWWGNRLPTETELAKLCAGAEVVVLRVALERLPEYCRQALVLDGADFTRGGSVELWRTKGGWAGRWANDLRGARPWTRPAMALVRPPSGAPGPGRLRPLRPNSGVAQG